MEDFKKLAHTVWECKYHLIWCPKYRFRILKGEVGKLLFPPEYSISEVGSFLKGKRAIKIFDKHIGLKRRYWGRHFWAKGYCVSTVGLSEEQIRKYVRWQLKKDKVMDQLKL